LVSGNQSLPCLLKAVSESFGQVISFRAQVPCDKEKVVETSLKSIVSVLLGIKQAIPVNYCS